MFFNNCQVCFPHQLAFILGEGGRHYIFGFDLNQYRFLSEKKCLTATLRTENVCIRVKVCR